MSRVNTAPSMENNTVDHLDKRSPRNCCICSKTPRKIYVLILLIALSNVAILVSLIAAHFSQRNEIRELRRSSAKAIAECRQDVASIKEKLDQQGRKNKTSIPPNIFGKSSAITKRAKVPKNVTRREPKSKRPISCPFNSQRRRKICLFIKKEVSRQAKLNLTEIRKEIRKDIEKDMFPKVYVNLLGKDRDSDLMNQIIPRIPTDRMYTIRWDYSILLKCAGTQDSKIKEQCRVTRLTDQHIEDRRKRNIDIVVDGGWISAVKVKVAGIYFVYCQLTLAIDDSKNSKNIAHHISKVSILTSREFRSATERIELISQTPVLTNQGNERLITVSMFTQAYLYKDSKVKVAISLRNHAPLPFDRMEVNMYSIRNNCNKRKCYSNKMFNVFGMYLLKKTDDQP